jgi:hypothetical protein
MVAGTYTKVPIRTKPSYLALHPRTIEKTFTDTVIDLKEIVVLDGIDILSDQSGFRVGSHDLHGQLPEILIRDSGNTFQDKEYLNRQACKLIAIVGLRKQMRRWLRGARFLAPTTVDIQAIVGFRVGVWTWMAEGNDFITACHHPYEQVDQRDLRLVRPRL